jgi:hypothetical protein
MVAGEEIPFSPQIHVFLHFYMTFSVRGQLISQSWSMNKNIFLKHINSNVGFN